MSICKECLHNEVCTYGENRSNGMYCTGDKCKKYKSTADVVEVRHGEWKTPTTINGRAFNVPHCSVCEGIPCGVDENTKFCPNCGAKMDGERRSENEG